MLGRCKSIQTQKVKKMERELGKMESPYKEIEKIIRNKQCYDCHQQDIRYFEVRRWSRSSSIGQEEKTLEKVYSSFLLLY